LIGEYSVKIMSDIWLGDNIEIGLSLNSKNPNTTDCNRTLLLTEQGFAYEKIKNNPKRQKRSFSQEIDWDHESLITGSQLGGQLTYLDHEVKESLIFQFTHSLRQLCEFAEETRKWTTTALLSNPTTLARAILNNTNLIARHISGTTLKIWPCIQLTPTQYNISPTNLETCFDLLPITMKTHGKDELAFLDPTNLLISPKARKAPCSQFRKIPIQINGTLMEIDQITGETATLYTLTLTSKSFHEIDIPKLLPHAFHHLVLVNLTDIITHSYFSSLTEVSQITYRIEQQNSAVKSTMSTDWEEVRKEIVNETLGDWSGIQNWFCLIVCIIAAIDITIRISAILIENYLKNFTIIRALTAKTATKQKTVKILETKAQPEATKKHQARYKNQPSQILLELGKPLEGQPNKWPPTATKFPLVIPPAPSPKNSVKLLTSKPNRDYKRSHSSCVLMEFLSKIDPTLNGPTFIYNYLPVINVTFDSMNVDCLIDTGSTVSLAPKGLIEFLGSPITEGEVIVITPSGHNVPIIGKTIVEIIICNYSREIDLYLVPDDKFIGEGTFQAILGCNLFTLLPPINIDFTHAFFYVGEECTSLINPQANDPYVLTLQNNFHNSTITAYINNSQFRCLADTGATFTAAPLSIAERLGSPIKYERLGAISASGHHMPIIASSNTQINVAGYLIPLEIKFVDNKHFHNSKDYDIILGCDTFAKLPPITFNHNENTLTIGSNITPMGITSRNRSPIGIRAFKSITIPPESQSLVPIKIDSNINSNLLSIDILDKRLAEQDFSLIPTLIEPKNNLAILPLINPTQEPKNIHQNMTIAYATEITFDSDLRLFIENNYNSIGSVEFTDQTSLVEKDPTFVIDFSKSSVKGPELESLKSLCNEFSDIFSKSQYDLGSCKAGSHNIVTTTQEPITSKPHRTPFKYRDELKKHIDQLLKSGVMIQSDTPWVSNLVLVQKKDGGLRPCIDFRKLNEITVPDHFPLPRLETIMEKIGNCCYYSSLDLSSGYLQIPLTQEASRKCGLITEEGVFQMTHLPFGLRNATAAFSRTMSHVLSGVENVLAYVDDILVYTKSPEFPNHLKTLRNVFERFRLFNLKLSPKKCKFATSSMEFLGYTVSGNGFIPSLSRIEVIKNLPTPKTLKQVRRIVGMASFYREHILGFATIVEPLTSLNKKNKIFDWGPKQEQAFQKIKELLAKEPILKFPDYKMPFHIFTDASSVGHGAALMQKHDGKFHAISYASRSLSPNERKWPPVQIELGAIIYALRTFRPYIYLSEVELHSDHRPLIYLQSKSQQHPQLARWLIEIQNYNIKIVHIEGKRNTLADALSRAHEPQPSINTPELEDIIEFPVCLSLDICDRIVLDPIINSLTIRTRDGPHAVDLVLEQNNDPEISQIIKFLAEGTLPDLDEETQKDFVAKTQNLTISSDVLYYYPPESLPRIYVPTSLRSLIFDSFHTSIIGGGHMNLRKTIHKCSRRYYWPKMYSDILTWTKQCMICQLRHNPIPLYRAEMRSVPANTLFARIGLDLAGPLPLTEMGNRHILNIICWFTKYVIAVPVPNTKSQTIAHALFKNVYLKFGGCTEILTDNATTFTSEFFRSFCSLLYINKTYSTPYHSQGNSVTERSFRTFHNILAKYINPNEPNFDEFLDAAAFCYNTSVHETTKETPFFLVFGRDPIFSIDQIMDNSISSLPQFTDLSDFKTRLVLSLRKAWISAAEATKQAQDKSKTQYDKHSRPQIIAIGDRVLLRNYTGKPGTSQKFHLPWKGLFRVIDADDIHATIISCTSPQSKPQRVHLNQIKKFIGPEITTPALTAPKIPSEESEALKQSQAVELNEVIGYNHELPENNNQNMNKSQDSQNPTGINPGTEIRNTHQYNLRSKRQ
uniref:RNA-directed DNA polymerase n=2 Tax=Meloidogyne TaxID=189290 RepID=A0A914NH21_MELIC